MVTFYFGWTFFSSTSVCNCKCLWMWMSVSVFTWEWHFHVRVEHLNELCSLWSRSCTHVQDLHDNGKPLFHMQQKINLICSDSMWFSQCVPTLWWGSIFRRRGGIMLTASCRLMFPCKHLTHWKRPLFKPWICCSKFSSVIFSSRFLFDLQTQSRWPGTDGISPGGETSW